MEMLTMNTFSTSPTIAQATPIFPVRQSPADGLMTASMALGIAAILTAVMATVYFPFILGGISRKPPFLIVLFLN